MHHSAPRMLPLHIMSDPPHIVSPVSRNSSHLAPLQGDVDAEEAVSSDIIVLVRDTQGP